MNSEGIYLVNISIGPVQGFVASARRTRDFWMGSTILSEVAKSVARWIVSNRSEETAIRLLKAGELPSESLNALIFPAPEKLEELLPWELDTIGSVPTDFRCTNIILATVSTEKADVRDMHEWADAARNCVQQRWREFCNRAFDVARGDVRDSLWNFQLTQNDVLETYVSWTPLFPNYRDARKKVVRMLSGRKSIRDFDAWNIDKSLRLPKTSLDARRETVLKEPKNRQGALHFRAKEELDLVGVVKRADFGKDAIRYPSVSRFAVDPWLVGATSTDADLSIIRRACSALASGSLRVLTQRSDRQAGDREDDFIKFPWFAEFPFEGTPLYVTRHSELLKEAFHLTGPERKGRQANDDYEVWRRANPEAERLLREAQGQLRVIQDSMQLLTRELGQPSPYFAVLKADGDHVGAAISRLAELNSADIHRVFSLSQSKFAKRAQEVINGVKAVLADPSAKVNSGVFRGAAVYTGGDDVLCFVPIHQCLQLARWLNAEFARMIDTTIDDSSLSGSDKQRMKSALAENPPTLSVGIAMGHFLEPLEDLLTYADEAEKRAKNPDSSLDAGQTSRNGFAITDHPRGGSSIGVRGNWKPSNSIIDRLESWQSLYLHEEIPSKAPYELRECARAFDNPWQDPLARTSSLRLVASRVFARKTAGRTVKGPLQMLHQSLQSLSSPADLEALACELLIAAHLAFAHQQAIGQGKSFGYGAFA